MELLNALGLNTKILIAQLVNFAVLLFVIYKFAYGPIMKILNERQEKIDNGIRDANEAKEKLVEISVKEREVLAKAREEARGIIKEAEKIAQKNKEDIANIAREESARITENAVKKIEQERQAMIVEIKKDISELVLVATEKVISHKLNSKDDQKMVSEIVNEIK